jgi:CheY-like chemotaxis protein
MLNTEADGATLQHSRSSLRVLVVDDDPFQLEVMGQILHSLGLRDVHTAPDVDIALQKVGQSDRPFDLLLTDLHMPGADGFQLMDAMAQRGFGGALIIASGQTKEVLHSASLVAQLRRFNLLGTVAKPVEKLALGRLIAQMA